MTDTASTFAVGDVARIHARSAWDGLLCIVTGFHSSGQIEVEVGDLETGFEPHELERIDVDPEAPAADAAVSTSMEGPSADDGSGPGSAAEPATEEPPVPTLEDLAAQVAALTRQVNHLRTIAQHQMSVNSELTSCLAILGISPSPFAGEPPYAVATNRRPVDGTFQYIEGAPRTTKRVHTKIVKNTKGYQHEISVEVICEDPDEDVNGLVSELMSGADLLARRNIIDAEYRDANGLPGDDEVDPDSPF